MVLRNFFRLYGYLPQVLTVGLNVTGASAAPALSIGASLMSAPLPGHFYSWMHDPHHSKRPQGSKRDILREAVKNFEASLVLNISMPQAFRSSHKSFKMVVIWLV